MYRHKNSRLNYNRHVPGLPPVGQFTLHTKSGDPVVSVPIVVMRNYGASAHQSVGIDNYRVGYMQLLLLKMHEI